VQGRAPEAEPRDSHKFFGSFFQKRTKEKELSFEKRSKKLLSVGAHRLATAPR
jgi:hypothetical protein